MYKKAIYLLLITIAFTQTAFSQSTYLPLNTQDNDLLDRLETRSGRLSDSLFLVAKPISREKAVDFLLQQQEDARYTGLSSIDRYNIRLMISENGEWTPDGNGAISSRHSWFNTFYTKQADFAYVKTKDFFLVVNPVLSGQVLVEQDDPAKMKVASNPMLTNSHGAEARGWIAKKIGFYTYFTDNQETPPSYVNSWTNKKLQALPGADWYTSSKPGYYDYLQASGYFTVDAVKKYLNISFGYGKNFLGDGISSMELTDFSANMPFLRLITRIWKIDYENLYLELTPQYSGIHDQLLNHKYATMHHLSYNATKWLNIGFFEATVFDRPNSYELGYLNPIILYRAVDRNVGDPDKELLGFDWKIIAAKHLQFYGQFMLNEFTSKEFFANHGYWANKWGLQLGGKYFDALTVKNLDLQAELNMVRPYTYTAMDTLANYTNYNQPLADPLGSDFIQFIGTAKYQPIKNLYLTLLGMYYVQGSDTGSSNLGNDIFKPYLTKSLQYGSHFVNGPRNTCELINFTVSYQLRQNLFIDLGATHRRYVGQAGTFPVYTTFGTVNGSNSTTDVMFGIRLNAPLRNYNSF
ncbi:MAG TPA: hypothetical protein VN721_10735 [Flavipsychrobacter sp.]|nr:hypothetical protein [Flavipsychrobacter sp.]